MATLTGSTIKDTYLGLLSVSGVVGTDTVEAVTDGAGTSTSLSLSQQRATITLGSGAADDFIVDGTTLVVEGDNNRVGIGTAAPTTPLHVKTSGNTEILVDATTGGAARLILDSNTNDSGSYISFSEDTAVEGSIAYDHSDDFMYFKGGGDNTIKMAIDTAGGKVGIGTNAPGALLNIQVVATTASTPLEALRVSVADTGGVELAAGHGPSIDFYVPDGSSSVLGARLAVVKENASDTSHESAMTFYTQNASTPSEKMRIDKDGNVGIGTTEPDTTLEVRNDHSTLYHGTNTIVDSTAVGNVGLTVSNYDSSAEYATIRLAARASGSSIWDIVNEYQAANDGDLIFRTRNAADTSLEVMRLDQDGNVGIGTAAPYSPLHIKSAAEGGVADGASNIPQVLIESSGTSAGNVGPTLCLHNSSTAVDNDYIGFISFTGGDSGDSSPDNPSEGTEYANISVRISDETDATTDGIMHFATDVNDTMTNTLCVTGGKVGIGTTEPSSLLDIRGPVGVDFACSGKLTLSTAEVDHITAADVLGIIQFEAAAHTGSGDSRLPGAAIWAEAEASFSSTVNSTAIVFATANSENALAYAQERMRITNAGNVGIGTSQPAYALEVQKDVADDGTLVKFDYRTTDNAVDNDDTILMLSFGDDADATGGHFIEFQDADDTEMTGTVHASSGTAVAHDTSDYRIKENISPITGGLEKINALKPSYFNYKRYSGIEHQHQGFIAHEVVEAGMGYAVTGEKDAMKIQKRKSHPKYGQEVEDIQMFAITRLIPQMVSAIQELSAKVTALENA